MIGYFHLYEGVCLHIEYEGRDMAVEGEGFSTWWQRTLIIGLITFVGSLLVLIASLGKDVVLRYDTPTPETMRYIMQELSQLPNKQIMEYVDQEFEHAPWIEQKPHYDKLLERHEERMKDLRSLVRELTRQVNQLEKRRYK